MVLNPDWPNIHGRRVMSAGLVTSILVFYKIYPSPGLLVRSRLFHRSCVYRGGQSHTRLGGSGKLFTLVSRVDAKDPQRFIYFPLKTCVGAVTVGTRRLSLVGQSRYPRDIVDQEQIVVRTKNLHPEG